MQPHTQRLVVNPEQLAACRLVYRVAPEAGQRSPTRDEEFGPGQWLAAGVRLETIGEALDVTPLVVSRRHLHPVPVEVEVVVADAASVEQRLTVTQGVGANRCVLGDHGESAERFCPQERGAGFLADRVGLLELPLPETSY